MLIGAIQEAFHPHVTNQSESRFRDSDATYQNQSPHKTKSRDIQEDSRTKHSKEATDSLIEDLGFENENRREDHKNHGVSPRKQRRISILNNRSPYKFHQADVTIDAKQNTEIQIDANSQQTNVIRIKKNQVVSLPDEKQMLKRSATIAKNSAVFNYHNKRQAYDKNSLYILKADFFLRKSIVWLVDWRVFEYFILLMILLNSITLAIYDYSDRDSTTSYNQILDTIGEVLTIIFIIEAILKIMAYGLILHENSYLRVGWNLIDLVVVITGLLELIVGSVRLKALRVLRALRPLRSINAIPSKLKLRHLSLGMKKLVKALISSIPDFVNVDAFLIFIYLLFAILGVHQYEGILYNRCRYNAVPTPEELIYGWQFDPTQTRVCSQSGLGMFVCPVNLHCGNPSDYGLSIDSDNVTQNAEINYGIYTYDNVAYSLQTVFQIITLDSWSSFMYHLIDADTPALGAIYCCIMVVTGSFFLMNLILAVIIQSFIKIQHKELDKELKQIDSEQNNVTLKISQNLEEKIDFKEEKKEQELPLNTELIQETHRDTEKNNDQDNSMRFLSNTEKTSDIQKSNIQLIKRATQSHGKVYLSINLLVRIEQLDRPEKSSIKTQMTVLNSRDPSLFRISEEKSEQNDKASQNNLSSKSKEPADFSFLKPITTKKKVLGVFSSAAQDRKDKDRIDEQLGEDEEIVQAEEEKKEQEGTLGLGGLFEQLALMKIKAGQDDQSQEQQNDSRLQSAFQNFMVKKQEDLINKDEFFSKLLKEQRENYKREKTQIKGQTSLSQLTQLKIGLRLQRDREDLSSHYKQFIMENRADKLKLYLFALKISKNRFFNAFVFLSIVGNTIILALDKYPQDDSLVIIFDRINIAFSIIFILEMLIKLIGFGVKGYFNDAFNCFDCFVVLTSIIDLFVSNILDSKKGGALNALRTFRLLRIFKLAKSWQRFQDLLVTMGRTLKDVSVFSILLYLFIFTYTLLGMEMFANKVKFDEQDKLDLLTGTSHSANFDTFLSASTTVFIVLLNFNWSKLYYDQYRAVGTVATVFFVSLVIIGQKILLNLFLAILLQNFDEDSLNREIQDKFKKQEVAFKLSRLDKLFQKVQSAIKNFFNIDLNKDDNPLTNEGIKQRNANQNDKTSSTFKSSGQSRKKNISTTTLIKPNENVSAKQLEINKTLIDDFQYLEGKSLQIFHVNNRFREFMYQVVTNTYFDYVIIGLIILSGIGLAVDNPLNDPDGDYKKAVYFIDQITTYAFLAEALAKIMVFGFVLNGRSSYLRNFWNILDFLIVVFSVLSMTPLPGSLKFFKLLRVARPLRIISRNKGLKVAVRALVQAVPNIFNVMIITLLFFVIFGIVGISYLKGKFNYCLQDKIIDFGLEIVSKWDCLNSGGEWAKRVASFDNILYAIKTLFQMSSTSGWTDIMFNAVAATDIDYEPIQGSNPYWQLFFILFMIVGGIFMLNLFIGVVISNFNREKEKIGMNNLLTDRQKEWLDTRLIVIKSKPIKKLKAPDNRIRKAFFQIQERKQFEYFILSCIMINTVILMIKWYDQPSGFVSALEQVNYFFTAIFALEAVIKIIALGKIYFKDGWNIFDFIIVVISIVSVLISKNTSFNLGGATTIVRTFRVARIFRLVKRAKSLKLVFNTFIISIPALANVGSLLLLLLYLYAVLGVQLFSQVKRNGYLTDAINFETFPKAFLTLFVFASGDSWEMIMNSILKEKDITFQCIEDPSYEDFVANGMNTIGCGIGVSGQLFFYSFYLIITLTFLNLFIAIILQGYEDTQTKENRLFNNDTLTQFRNVWADFDPEATTFIPILEIKKFLFALGYPLGFDKSFEGSKFKQDKFIISLDLPIYNDFKDYQFLDVLDALSLRMVVRENYLKKKKEQQDEDHLSEENENNDNKVLKRQVSESLEKEIRLEIDQEINKLKFQDQALNIHAVQRIQKDEEKALQNQQKLQKDEYFTSLHQAAAEVAFNHMRYVVKKRKAQRSAESVKNQSGVSSKVNNSNPSQKSSSKPSLFLDNKNLQNKTTFNQVQLKVPKQSSQNKSPNEDQEDRINQESRSSFRSSMIETPNLDKMIQEEMNLGSNPGMQGQMNLEILQSELKIVEEEQKLQEIQDQEQQLQLQKSITNLKKMPTYIQKKIENDKSVNRTNQQNIDVQRNQSLINVSHQQTRQIQDGSLGGTGGYVLSSEGISEDARSYKKAQDLALSRPQSQQVTVGQIQMDITQIIKEEVRRRIEKPETQEYIDLLIDEEEKQLQSVVNNEIIDDSFISDFHQKLERHIAEVEVMEEQSEEETTNPNFGESMMPAKRIQIFLTKQNTTINY